MATAARQRDMGFLSTNAHPSNHERGGPPTRTPESQRRPRTLKPMLVFVPLDRAGLAAWATGRPPQTTGFAATA